MGLLGLPHTMFISGHRHRKAWLMFNKGQCGANKNWRSISKMNGKTNCSVATYLIRSVRHFIHGHDKFSKLIYNILPNLHSNRRSTRLGLFCFCAVYITFRWNLVFPNIILEKSIFAEYTRMRKWRNLEVNIINATLNE